ncbi:MAG: protein-export membrane protein SecF [Candidatus Parcubacteria bacterium]|nr:MAG: protein-export membrane protein SecF [Candidatus Parcubacteria bacterium]
MISKRYYFYFLSIFLSVLTIIFYFIFPLNLGIDFTGGQLIEIQTKIKDIQNIKNVINIDGTIITSLNSVIIKAKEIDQNKIIEEIRKIDSSAEIIRHENVSKILSNELVRKSFWAIILVLISIGIYITFVFSEKRGLIKSWLLGLIVILTLFHDILITFGFYLLLSYIYKFEFTITIIVAFLLIAGFSVHDTIVVFDRLRENIKKINDLTSEIFDNSIKQTLARSINTSLTAILAILPIAFLIEILRPFIITLIAGFIIGTYSSICISIPLAYDLSKKDKLNKAGN